MPIYFLEPGARRYALSVSAKVACVSTRMWMWQQAHRDRHAKVCIFKRFHPLTVWMGQRLPDSVELAVAIHRDGVSRLRAVYDHRIRREREAPDLGLDHFARHLPEYCALYPSIAHHCKPQSAWLGSDPDAFTDILPLDRLDLLVDLVRKVTGVEPPPLPLIHATHRKTPVSPEAEKWLREWTAHDTALGWDGVTLRLFEDKAVAAPPDLESTFIHPKNSTDGPQPEHSGDSRRQMAPMELMVTD